MCSIADLAQVRSEVQRICVGRKIHHPFVVTDNIGLSVYMSIFIPIRWEKRLKRNKRCIETYLIQLLQNVKGLVERLPNKEICRASRQMFTFILRTTKTTHQRKTLGIAHNFQNKTKNLLQQCLTNTWNRPIFFFQLIFNFTF